MNRVICGFDEKARVYTKIGDSPMLELGDVVVLGGKDFTIQKNNVQEEIRDGFKIRAWAIPVENGWLSLCEILRIQ